MLCYRKRLEAPHNISLVCLPTSLHITHLSALQCTLDLFGYDKHSKQSKLFHVQVKERMAQNHCGINAITSLLFMPCQSYFSATAVCVTGGQRFVFVSLLAQCVESERLTIFLSAKHRTIITEQELMPVCRTKT